MHRSLLRLLLRSLVVVLAVIPGARAADRSARSLEFAPGSPIDRVDIGVLDDVKDRGKKFVGTGTLVLIDSTSAPVKVTEKIDKKGRSKFVVKTFGKSLPKLVTTFTMDGTPPVVVKAKTSFKSVTKSKTKLTDAAHLSLGASAFALGLNAVPEDATDDVPLRLHFGAAALPTSKSWASTLPPIGDQGQQSSCVGWSSAYYVKSSWEKRSDPAWNSGAQSGQFSPAFVYNQINGGQDAGSQPSDALSLMIQKGAATWASMPYSVNDFRAQPSQQVLGQAANYKNLDQRFFGDRLNVTAVKEYLAETGPLVFGIEVDRALQQGTGVYTQFVGPNEGGHAIACVGYDDAISGGSFLLANSWGPTYRDQGFVWVTYQAMNSMFLGAWAMVDGPNSGGGGGGQPGEPSGFTASTGESNGYVALRWQFLPGAAGFRLERQLDSGAWQTIASPKADVFYHQDFDVAAGRSYNYRLAGVDGSGAVGPYATSTGSTSNGGGGGAAITLTASNPTGGGTSYPDRIHLGWNTISGNPWYVVLRSDSEEGFRNGQYIVLDYAQSVTSYDDYVAPGSRFAYEIAAIDPFTYELTTVSNSALGSTSGGGGGALDLGIVELDETLVVTRGLTAPLDITVFNYGATCAHENVFVGVYYYFADGTTGILSYADAVSGTTPIWFYRHDVSMQPFEYGLLLADPYAPVYLYPSGTANVGFWWYVEVYPADANGNFLPDADENDNAMYGNSPLYVY